MRIKNVCAVAITKKGARGAIATKSGEEGGGCVFLLLVFEVEKSALRTAAEAKGVSVRPLRRRAPIGGILAYKYKKRDRQM